MKMHSVYIDCDSYTLVSSLLNISVINEEIIHLLVSQKKNKKIKNRELCDKIIEGQWLEIFKVTLNILPY